MCLFATRTRDLNILASLLSPFASTLLIESIVAKESSADIARNHACYTSNPVIPIVAIRAAGGTYEIILAVAVIPYVVLFKMLRFALAKARVASPKLVVCLASRALPRRTNKMFRTWRSAARTTFQTYIAT